MDCSCHLAGSTCKVYLLLCISRAYKKTRVEPSTVLTSADGIASTYLWLAGMADENTVTADVPLCLNHAVFTAIGEQSYGNINNSVMNMIILLKF